MIFFDSNSQQVQSYPSGTSEYLVPLALAIVGTVVTATACAQMSAEARCKILKAITGVGALLGYIAACVAADDDKHANVALLAGLGVGGCLFGASLVKEDECEGEACFGKALFISSLAVTTLAVWRGLTSNSSAY